MPTGPYGKSIQNTWVARFKGKFHDACPNQHSFIDLAATRLRIEAWKIHYNPIRLAFPLFLSQPQRRINVSPIPHSRPGPKQGQRYVPDCREIMKRPRAAGIMARAGAVPFWGLLGAVLAIPLLAGPVLAQQTSARPDGELPGKAVRQIEALLAAKAQRTPAQRKVSSQLLEAQRTPPQRTVNSQLLDEQPAPTQRKLNSQLLDEQRTPTQRKLNSQLQDALRAPLQKLTAAGTSRLQATDPDTKNKREATEADAKNERVMVDIRADVTPTVLKRIRDLGGTVISSVPKYQAIRAQLPPRAVERLAALDAIRTIRPADEAVTRKDNTSEGVVAHRANSARRTHSIDGTGIGIGVISNGVRSLADRQASGDLPARVTVLPGQAGRGDEGTALLEIVHDLAPGAELYFATGSRAVRHRWQ